MVKARRTSASNSSEPPFHFPLSFKRIHLFPSKTNVYSHLLVSVEGSSDKARLTLASDEPC